ncbi:transcription initiation factor IIB [Coemansia sp. RSA 1722]|nr:transcription initiation factor IIB [Coemansia sp. RSA 1722]KAJ2635885.1 transcription initiation factor IIB [Coemansia sp. RSA 1286]
MATSTASSSPHIPSPQSTLVCPRCCNSPANLIHDFSSDDLICGDCNTSISERLGSPQAEWRRRHQLLSDSRLVLSSTKYTAHIPTKPEHTDDSSSNSDGSDKPSVCLNRAMRSRSSRAVIQRQERNMMRAFSEITSMCATMDLPSTVTPVARDLYQRVEEGNLHRGKNIDAIIATCIFLACRQKSVPRTFKEICAFTRVPRKDIGRTFKFLKEKLGADAGSMSSDDLMARFCANLSLLSTAQECAVLLNKAARQRDTLAGKSPVSIAGACIYMASHLVGQPRDVRVISHVAGVSEATIKNSYKILYADRRNLILPQMLQVDPMASLENLPPL